MSTSIVKLEAVEPEIDRENAFLLYATFCGDCVRTAHALGIQPDSVARIAEASGWNDKLAPILALKKSTRPGDVERAVNRALNFVQAHKMRMFVGRVINRLTGLNDKQFEDLLHPAHVTKAGVPVAGALSTRAIADLASAMEKCQAMSYQALNDTSTDRAKRHENEGDAEVSAGDMHARIAQAMSGVGEENSPAARLLDAQLVEAARLKHALKQQSK